MMFKILPTMVVTCVNLLMIEGFDYAEESRGNDAFDLTARIHYGTAARVSDFPFLTKLDLKGSIGGGSIISENWILTAAHCLHGVQCSAIKVMLAIQTSDSFIPASYCYPHPGYASVSNPHHKCDVGLIRVEENLLQYPGAQKIPLPSPGTNYPVGTSAVIVGWGLAEDGTLPDHLKRGEIRVTDWDSCNRKYVVHVCKSSPRCIAQIPRRVVCAQAGGYSPDGTCFGDSGGPVIINGVVAGIVSFGLSEKTTCLIGAPNILTNVVDYLPWIYSFIDPNVDTSQMPVQPED